MISAEFYGNKSDETYLVFLENYWSLIRQKRDELIRDTDWTQIPDAPISAEKKAEFSEYRQSLRDLTELYDSPEKVVWPPIPEI